MATCEQPALTQGRGKRWPHREHRDGFHWGNCYKWPSENSDPQISAILGGLEAYILRKKRRIYESLTASVQNDLKPCYEGAGPSGNVSASSGVFLSAPLASSSAASASKDLSSCILVPLTLLGYILKSNNCKGVGRGNSETIFTCVFPVPSLYSWSRHLASPPCAASQLIKL